MDQIDSVDAVLADFTLNPANVYFQLGYARGKGKPIIQTARKDTSLEFDVRNWRTLFYKNATELEVRSRRLSSKSKFHLQCQRHWHVRFVEADIHPRVLGEHPSTITDDLVARASGITGVAQRQSSSFQVAAVRFDKEASNRQEATRLAWTQTGPVTVFYGRSGRRIQGRAVS